jgi:uncharacterized protein YqeY
MTLEKIQADMIQALKNGEATRKLVLSDIIAAVKNAAIAKRCKGNITEELVNEVLLKEQKTFKEMIDTCPKDRQDILDNYIEQYNIITEYAPALIEDEDTIADAIIGICKASEIPLAKANKGLVMKAIMPSFKGKVDMKITNKVLSSLLN